jgi:hypothetical protein
VRTARSWLQPMVPVRPLRLMVPEAECSVFGAGFEGACKVSDQSRRKVPNQLSIAPGGVDIELPFRGDVTQQHGFAGNSVRAAGPRSVARVGYRGLPRNELVCTLSQSRDLRV